MSQQSSPYPGPPITAAEVQQAQFRVVMRGYDQSDVDEFLDGVVSRLNAGHPPLAAPPGPFRVVMRGYDPTEVDALLDRLSAVSGLPAGPVPPRPPTAGGSAVTEPRKRRWFRR